MLSIFLKHRLRLTAKVVALFAVLFGMLALVTPISGHPLQLCGGFPPVRWPGTSTDTYYPPGWASTYRTAVNNAATAFSQSDFDYYVIYTQPAQTIWGNLK